MLVGADRLWRLGMGDERRPGADAGTPVRDVDGSAEPIAPLLRADDTWIAVDSDGDSRPPVLGIRE
ncbi:hypothetical protein [Streptomyces sp. NPDC002265]|uniref:hypothetical protein n=1 Tax=Streptomyces sp. NPDC002265 TaxID=3154415 RepID=UPI00332F6400